MRVPPEFTGGAVLEFAFSPITPVEYKAVINPVTATTRPPRPVRIPGRDVQKAGFDSGASAILEKATEVFFDYL